MIYNILDGKAAYYRAPKCGCSTITAWVTLLEEPTLYDDKIEWFTQERYRRIFKYIDKNRYFGYYDTSNHPVRFCMVRDPVDRFLSGYTNRVVYHQDIQKEVKNIPVPNVDEFIERFDYFCDICPVVNNHFKSQVHFYKKDSKHFTHIFNFKQFNEVKVLLEQIGNIELPNLHLQRSKGLQKPVLSDSQVEWIKNKYKEDYEVYGSYMS